MEGGTPTTDAKPATINPDGSVSLTLGSKDDRAIDTRTQSDKPVKLSSKLYYHGTDRGDISAFVMPEHGGKGLEDSNTVMPNAIHFTSRRSLAEQYAKSPRSQEQAEGHLYSVSLRLTPDNTLSLGEYGSLLDNKAIARLAKVAPDVDWINIGGNYEDPAYTKFNKLVTPEILRKAGYAAVKYYDESPEFEGPAVAVVDSGIATIISKRTIKFPK